MLQLPLNVQLDDFARFDNYFVANNQQLVLRLESLVNSPGDFVFVWGTRESGKTHLAQALCHNYNANNLSAVYLPLRNVELSADILIGMNCMDLVCLDDMDAVEDDSEWEHGIFDLYNNLKQENKSLVIFSANSPAQSQISLADLQSRLSAMEIYKLEALDDTEKQSFFIQRAANRGIEISEEVANFVLSRRSRSVSDLIALLAEIDRSSIALQRKVTIPLIKEVFNL